MTEFFKNTYEHRNRYRNLTNLALTHDLKLSANQKFLGKECSLDKGHL